MSTMNVSLPNQMKDWVNEQIQGGQYHNISEYVRDLIRKDQAEHEKTQAFRAAIQQGRASGIEKRSFAAVVKSAKRNAKTAK